MNKCGFKERKIYINTCVRFKIITLGLHFNMGQGDNHIGLMAVFNIQNFDISDN